MVTCDWNDGGADAELGPLGFDYTRAYYCSFAEQGWAFFPLLLGWGCFLTYLRK